MKATIKRVVGLVLGWALVVLGVVGLFVPILQGVLLILLGLWVLSRESRWARRCLRKLRLRYPVADRKLREIQAGFRGWRERRRATGEGNDDERQQ